MPLTTDTVINLTLAGDTASGASVWPGNVFSGYWLSNVIAVVYMLELAVPTKALVKGFITCASTESIPTKTVTSILLVVSGVSSCYCQHERLVVASPAGIECRLRYNMICERVSSTVGGLWELQCDGSGSLQTPASCRWLAVRGNDFIRSPSTDLSSFLTVMLSLHSQEPRFTTDLPSALGYTQPQYISSTLVRHFEHSIRRKRSRMTSRLYW